MAKDKKTVTNAMRLLNAAKIQYDTIEYEADEVGDNFGGEIAKLTGIPPEQSFKTLVARGDKTGVIVCSIPVDHEADLKKLAKASGNKKAEMIHVKELLGLTGYIRGGVSPIGIKKKYPTAASGGRCGTTLMIAPDDLQRITDCEFHDITKED